jgi:hypothetical protein
MDAITVVELTNNQEGYAANRILHSIQFQPRACYLPSFLSSVHFTFAWPSLPTLAQSPKSEPLPQHPLANTSSSFNSNELHDTTFNKRDNSLSAHILL